MTNSIKMLLEEIEKRPAMYIGKNMISCLRAYIDGWYYRNPETAEDMKFLNDFSTWVKEKYFIENTEHSWDRIILFYSQDESDALVTFFKDLKEFKNQK